MWAAQKQAGADIEAAQGCSLKAWSFEEYWSQLLMVAGVLAVEIHSAGLENAWAEQFEQMSCQTPVEQAQFHRK